MVDLPYPAIKQNLIKIKCAIKTVLGVKIFVEIIFILPKVQDNK
jgi:hypothetical protein